MRREYAASTIDSYIKIVEAFRQHAGKRLDRIAPDDLRRYHLFLLEDRKLAVGTVVIPISPCGSSSVVLKRRDMKEDLPYPKQRLRCRLLSPDEVQRLIAGERNLYHRTMLMTLYGAGLRRSEPSSSKSATSIASAWCCESSKAKAAVIARSPSARRSLPRSASTYRWMRPRTYLFPGTHHGWRADSRSRRK